MAAKMHSSSQPKGICTLTSASLEGSEKKNPKSSALALQSATPQVATTHVLGCQATKPMMTAFTKMMRPMKESKKDEEINSCMLRRCLSSLGEVRPGVVLVVLKHLRVYV